jgi:MFS family permease
MAVEFTRDRVTWVAYGLLAWFAYLQAAPGLIVAHLRDEFGLSHTTGGLHVAAFAAGALVAGLVSGPFERRIGRRALFWASVGVMGLGAIGLCAGRGPAATIGSCAVMGLAGGMLLVTIQALLSDHHGERRAVALTEANVAASVAYVVLIGALSLAAATGTGWRVALLASLLVPISAWSSNRRMTISTPPAASVAGGRLPATFWVAATMLFCTTAVEWCIAAWGASFVEDAAGVSADVSVSLMVGYFGGVVAGRIAGSALARRHSPHRLLAIALVVTAAGFTILWPAGSPLQSLLGLALLGVGIGNLFPLGLTVTVSLAPDRALLASGRAVFMTSFAVLLAPLAVGALADATSLSAALAIVPVALALAATCLTLVTRARNLNRA